MELKDYKEYQELFKDDLVVAVRNLLKKIEDGDAYDLEDSSEHNALVRYFNKFRLHKKLTSTQFDKWDIDS